MSFASRLRRGSAAAKTGAAEIHSQAWQGRGTARYSVSPGWNADSISDQGGLASGTSEEDCQALSGLSFSP